MKKIQVCLKFKGSKRFKKNLIEIYRIIVYDIRGRQNLNLKKRVILIAMYVLMKIINKKMNKLVYLMMKVVIQAMIKK